MTEDIHLEFDPAQRKELEEILHVIDDNDLVVKLLESLAETHYLTTQSYVHKPRSHELGTQTRKEYLNSLINHLKKAEQVYFDLDMNLQGELARHYSNITGIGWNPFRYDHSRRPDLLRDDPVLALVKLREAAEMVQEDFPKDKWNLNVELARYIRQTFEDRGLKFTVSNQGDAAKCLRAVLHLSGNKLDRVDHLLIKAKDAPLKYPPPPPPQ